MSPEKKQHDTQAMAFEFVANAENSLISILQAKSIASLWLESIGASRNNSIETHLLSNIISTLSRAEDDASLTINFELNKFDDISVVRAGEESIPAVERGIDTAETLKTFKGLSLEAVEAFQNIAAMNEVGLLLVAAGDENSDLGDCVIAFARDYATAAHAYALENQK